MNMLAETISIDTGTFIADRYQFKAPSRSGYGHRMAERVFFGSNFAPDPRALRVVPAGPNTDIDELASVTAGYFVRLFSERDEERLLTSVVRDGPASPRLTAPIFRITALEPMEAKVDAVFVRSLNRLNYLRSLGDGWLGVESFGASETAGAEAEALLRRLHNEMPGASLPTLGLDADGTVVMSWSRNGRTGSMTVYGDGTFSYFVRTHGEVARNSEARIDQPIDEALKRLLEK